MKGIAKGWPKRASKLLISLLLLLLAGCGSASAQGNPPQVGEGCLVYRSAVADGYQTIPLLHTDVALDVRGLVVAGTVTQQYANDSEKPIEAIYIFPLPHDAAVYDMEIRVGNRVIRSAIKERAEAKRTYAAAKTAGKHAALVEEERPNIFTMSVANIMPGDRIDVRLRYVERLRWENSRVRLTFPMVVGPRYIPGSQATGHSGSGWSADTDAVADASRITPLLRDQASSRPGHDISISANLELGFEIGGIQSPSHEILIEHLPDGRQHVELAQHATIPNKDFVLEAAQAPGSKANVALFLSPKDDSGETHFLLAAFPPSAAPQERAPVEMFYMIDVSGSMEGTSITQAREALLQALDRLRPEDRFAVLQFNHSYQEFSSEPLPATPTNVAAAREYVRRLEASGGTEMLPALLHLMQKPATPGHLRHIVLLTDGDLGNEEQIFDALRHDLGDARLYTVAIGSAPNLFLATKMAQYGRGTFTHIADIKEVREQMTHLFTSIENPVLTDVQLSFEGVEVADLYPQRPPDMYLGQPLLLYGRFTKGRVGKLHLTARAGLQPYETTIPINTKKAAFHPGITTLWAQQKTDELLDAWRRANESERAAIRQEIIDHAIAYRLVTRFTSLVAVEEIVVNEGGQATTVPVATELPAGWEMDKVFGAPKTGTADDFLRLVGLMLVAAGAALWWLTRRPARGEL